MVAVNELGQWDGDNITSTQHKVQRGCPEQDSGVRDLTWSSAEAGQEHSVTVERFTQFRNLGDNLSRLCGPSSGIT